MLLCIQVQLLMIILVYIITRNTPLMFLEEYYDYCSFKLEALYHMACLDLLSS